MHTVTKYIKVQSCRTILDMAKLSALVLIFFSSFRIISCTKTCTKLEVSVTQKVEHEGFHREIRWLIETIFSSKESALDPGCKMAIRLDVSNGMFVNPDEVAELNRMKKLPIFIDGYVDIEAPAHEANEHIVYIFLNNSEIERASINLPIHLRYQRGQITGGYGKVSLRKPSILVWCPETLDQICGRGLKVEAPCDETSREICIWKNFTYQPLFDEVELFVPVGNLDDYPLVSIVTLLLGCAGCIYILSVLSTTPL